MDTEIKQNNGLEFLESKRACLAGLSIDFLYKKWHQNVTVGLYVLKQKKIYTLQPFLFINLLLFVEKSRAAVGYSGCTAMATCWPFYFAVKGV